MKAKALLLGMAVALIVGALACAPAFAAGPQQITFKIVGPTGGPFKNLRWGNMVSPDGSCTFWSGDSANNPVYIWHNMGNNVNKFALELNYDMPQGGTWAAATAHGIVIVDPTQMSGDNVNVAANLQPCTMGPGNVVLALMNVAGPAGVTTGNCASVPPCTNWQK
jgi:hypothetical protein